MEAEQQELFEAIERGDLEKVHGLLLADDLLEYDRWGSSLDINAPNEDNMTAFAMAVKSKDLEMAKLLLKCGATVRNTLLTAVETTCVPIIRLICEHLKEKKITLKAILDAFGEDEDYLTPTTPLMYAARHNYHDIVKILIDYGAVIPDLEDVLKRTQRDTYEDNQVCLYWYQAVTCESYLVYSTADPIQAILTTGNILRISKSTVLRHRKSECEKLTNNLDTFFTKFISMARNGEEIDDIIRRDKPGGSKKTESHGVLPMRVHDALDLDFKMFISGDACSHFMTAQWYGTWQGISTISFLLWTLLVVITQPFLCFAYILLPFERIRRTLRTPYVRYLLHAVSKVYFVGFLIGISVAMHLEVAVDYERYCQLKSWFTAPPKIGIYFFYVWLIGMIWRDIQAMLKAGLKSYWSNVSNYVDWLQIILYCASIGLYWKSYTDQNSALNLDRWNTYLVQMSDGKASCILAAESGLSGIPGNVANTTRYESVDSIDYSSSLFLNVQNPLLISDALFAIASVLSFRALFCDMLVVEFVGPLCVSLGALIADVIRFVIIIIFMWIAFSIGMRQLYQTYDIVTTADCHIGDECHGVPFTSLQNTMGALFWSGFSPIETWSLHLNPALDTIGDTGEFLYGIYMLLVVVVMVYLLIAIMNNTDLRMKHNSYNEWKVKRTQLMATYMTKTATLPPPFNIFPSVRTIISCITRHKRCQSESKRLKFEEVEMKSSLAKRNKSYQSFIKKVSERFTKAHFPHNKDDNDKHRETIQLKADVATLKGSVLTMQSELMKNQQLLLDLGKQKEAEGRKTTWLNKKGR